MNDMSRSDMNHMEPPPPPLPEEPVAKELPDLNTPGMILMIFGILGILLSIYSVLNTMFGDNATVMEFLDQPDYRELEQQIPALGQFVSVIANPAFSIANALVGLLASGVIALGGFKMKERSSYGLAMAAAILAAIPCFSSCCCLDVPVGIWALILLTREGVRDAFDQ